MTTIKTLYHGSAGIVKKPQFGKGNPRNDYGLGFYCTEDLELAKEWACGDKRGGFANIYTIDTSNLSVINLSCAEYGVMNWLAVLVNNRIFAITSPLAAEAQEYLTGFFLPDLSLFDAILGYRADDSYFTFAMDFLNNAISLSQLSRAMRLGELGEQFVLKSRKAFDQIEFVRSEAADGKTYYPKRKKRDSDAREQYLKRERKIARSSTDIFMLDILREEMKQGDERLQTNLFE
ncbi:MAG: DUF3990 domain-containing protein [Oscillospiraceae bacterium]|nr:DUF3990 domain-containing protein [Oscillospiraceae bacterium]